MAKKKNYYVTQVIKITFFLYVLSIFMTIFGFVLIFRDKLLHKNMMIIMAAFAVLFFLILWDVIEKNVIKRYRIYKELFREFTDGQIYKELMEKSCDVFPNLDGVLLRFDDLVDRNKTIQLSTKQAEFLALQNQINPHFLYNTLDAIRGDALCAGMDNIADITEALSTFFRYTITEVGNLVTLEDELENIDNYFTIQKYRFGDKLKIHIDIEEDDEILQLQCPKLMLQPIVENAIFHGLEKKNKGGIVSIDFDVSDSRVVINVRDDGIGIDEDTLNKINQKLDHISMGYIVDEGKHKSGIALNNVCRRIKLLFGEEYGIHIYSMQGLGTQACISLPMLKGKK
ncbi:MAG: histidine kinase [Lachnospiraceae bacterium]|nr:histidine kinase [Lachnospiraceae bacterium]